MYNSVIAALAIIKCEVGAAKVKNISFFETSTSTHLRLLTFFNLLHYFLTVRYGLYHHKTSYFYTFVKIKY